MDPHRFIVPLAVTAVMAFSFILCYESSPRSKRTIAFPYGSSFGYLAAVAVPLDLPPNRNVYVAFNLETNYGLPPNDTHYYLINKWNLSGMFSDLNNSVTHIEGGSRTARSPYTRTSFYRSVVGYFELFGVNGTGCLLRTICEVAESGLFVSNGVLGSIFHVLFLPTSSMDENVPDSLYDAEEHGFASKCHIYEDDCPESFLSMISIELTLPDEREF